MKVIGVGLNKTGTKTLKYCFEQWGMKHQSYDLNAFQLYRDGKIDSLLAWMEDFDSFEDWPWPLFYKQIDQRYPDAKFVLTTRESPERWYKSLCKMAVRMGPLNDFEKHIYGYSMPQGRFQEHREIYDRHNREVENYFADRPGKLLKICWEKGEGGDLAQFLNQPELSQSIPKLNESLPVYGGDNLMRAQISRILFQSKWKLKRLAFRVRRKLGGNKPAN